MKSIRDDEATTSKELIFFNALTDVPITSLKTRVESMKASKLFRKYPKTADFDHSNYRLFERIPAVPCTSNNRGLTVVVFGSSLPSSTEKKMEFSTSVLHTQIYRDVPAFL